MSEEKRFTESEAHEHFAKKLNGEVWNLLGQEQRTEEEDDRMVHAAHASLYHWLHAGTAVHRQRAEWLLSHVDVELGLAERALVHAKLCMELTEAHPEEMEDSDRAYALEALARANAVTSNRDEALRYRAQAEEAAEAIADADSKGYFQGDLKGGNWGVLN